MQDYVEELLEAFEQFDDGLDGDYYLDESVEC